MATWAHDHITKLKLKIHKLKVKFHLFANYCIFVSRNFIYILVNTGDNNVDKHLHWRLLLVHTVTLQAMHYQYKLTIEDAERSYKVRL